MFCQLCHTCLALKERTGSTFNFHLCATSDIDSVNVICLFKTAKESTLSAERNKSKHTVAHTAPRHGFSIARHAQVVLEGEPEPISWVDLWEA